MTRREERFKGSPFRSVTTAILANIDLSRMSVGGLFHIAVNSSSLSFAARMAVALDGRVFVLFFTKAGGNPVISWVTYSTAGLLDMGGHFSIDQILRGKTSGPSSEH